MNSTRLYIASRLIAMLPETRCFGLKRSLLRWCGASVGANVRICSSARILGAGKLVIGDNTWIGHEVLIVCSDRIVIGADVNIAPRVFIGTGTHRIEPQSTSIGGEGISYPVTIGDGSWICASVTILPGSDLGPMSIIAAGALYKSKSSDSHLLWGGIPAKPIRTLYGTEQITNHNR